MVKRYSLYKGLNCLISGKKLSTIKDYLLLFSDGSGYIDDEKEYKECCRVGNYYLEVTNL